ncbi:MAG: beta-phosphoglucomutase [Acholeplasmatales bacterium]|nr:beta-phosphoglucomutase [Acholeplasmatales bacterium]
MFDLDGVLVSTDEFHYEAWKEVASSLDINFTKEDNNRLRGVSRMESLEIVLSLKPSLKLSISQKEEIAKKKNEIYKQLLDKLSPKSISEDTLYVLSELKNMGYKLAIGSSSKNAKYILERTNLLSYFDSVSDGNNITKTKPDPEVFLKASEMLGLKPSKCVVVEDAHAGIDAANKGGFLSIGLGDASSYKDANIKIKSLSQILDILRK